MFITRVHISLQVKLPKAELEKHLSASAEVVGELLTEQIVENVKRQGLGYFPAIEFFQQQGLIDGELIDAAETIGWFAAKLAREEVKRRLRSFFSTLEFQSVKCNAFGMPTVRPNQLDAWSALVKHYTPNQVKLDVIASVLKKHDQPEGMVNWARQLCKRNLQGVFESFEVTAVSLV